MFSEKKKKKLCHEIKINFFFRGDGGRNFQNLLIKSVSPQTFRNLNSIEFNFDFFFFTFLVKISLVLIKLLYLILILYLVCFDAKFFFWENLSFRFKKW